MPLTPSVRRADGRVGTVLHAADLHLGAPLKALGSRLEPEVVDEIRRLSTRAFTNLVDLAIAEEVDVVVLAGDVYDSAEYEVRSQLRVVEGLRQLTDAGIRVFIAHGNHDPLRASMRLAAEMPEGVTVFDPGDPQVETVELASGHPLHIAGLSFDSVNETANLAQRFHGLHPPDARSTVGVLHCSVGGRPGHEPYAPCTVADLEAAPVGYWALGHIHQREVNELAPGRWWAYPGNLQGRSAKDTECGPKGVLLVPVLHDGFGEPEFRVCAEVRFERVDVDVSQCEDIDSALTVIGESMTVVAADSPSLVARVRLTGRSPAHRDLASEGDDQVLAAVSERLGVTASRAVTRVEIATGPPVTREQLLARADLVAALLGHFDATPDHRALIEGLMSDMVATHRQRLTQLLDSTPGLTDEIVARAEQLLIDRLEDAS